MLEIMSARSIGGGCLKSLIFLLLSAFSQPCFAQLLTEFDTASGIFFGGVEIGKTTDIGKFDDYVGPLLAKELRSFVGLYSKKNTNFNNSRNVNQVSDYIHDGKRNLSLKYAGRLGWRFTVGYETARFYSFNDKGLRISFFRTFDVNSLKAFAPHGVGILTDPTSFTAEARIENTGLTIEAPVLQSKSDRYDHTSYLGLGVIRNWTRSHGVAKSDFLDISIVEKREIDRPLFSLVHRIRPLTKDDPASFGLDVGAQVFRTSKMFNVNFNIALVKSFQ